MKQEHNKKRKDVMFAIIHVRVLGICVLTYEFVDLSSVCTTSEKMLRHKSMRSYA